MLDRPLLSICIPTWNRAELLDQCLRRILESFHEYMYNDIIEIIVSDNGSTDSTPFVVSKYKHAFCNFRYYRNATNIGFNQNMLLLLTTYATGQYLWFLGDDDLVTTISLSILVYAIHKYNPRLILLRHNIEGIPNIYCPQGVSFFLDASTLDSYFKILPFSKAVDEIAVPSNVLVTYFGCSVYRKDLINMKYVAHIQDNHWRSFVEVFPNSYLLFGSFSKEKQVCLVNLGLINVKAIEKEWDNKMVDIWRKFLPQLCVFAYSLGIKRSDLTRNRIIILKGVVGSFCRSTRRWSKVAYLIKNLVSVFSYRVLGIGNQNGHDKR